MSKTSTNQQSVIFKDFYHNYQLNINSKSIPISNRNPKALENNRVKSVIVNNFIKKYLPPLGPQSDQNEIQSQLRMTDNIVKYVDEYFSHNDSSNHKSIQDLEKKLLNLIRNSSLNMKPPKKSNNLPSLSALKERPATSYDETKSALYKFVTAQHSTQNFKKNQLAIIHEIQKSTAMGGSKRNSPMKKPARHERLSITLQQTPVHKSLRANNQQVNIFQENQARVGSVKRPTFAPSSQSSFRQNELLGSNLAQFRAKLGLRQNSQESLPSNISDDAWGEVQKYQSIRDKELLRKEKLDEKNKKKQIQSVLLTQLNMKQRLTQQKNYEEFENDHKRLQEILTQEEIEKKNQKQEKKRKILEEKRRQDEFLKQTINEQKNRWMLEKDEESQLLKRIEQQESQETLKIKQIKRQNFLNAQKILIENDVIKRQREKQMMLERENEMKLIRDQEMLALREEERRKKEKDDRENKIKAAVNRMANTVVKDQDQQNRDQEEKIKKYELQKEQELRQKEKQIYERENEIKSEIKRALSKQIKEKKMNIEQEFYKNKEYIDTAITEDIKKKQLEQKRDFERKQRFYENQKYLKSQMGMMEKNYDSVTRMKMQGTMTNEEIRLNKELLKEISAKKKEQSSKLSSLYNSLI